MPTRSSRFTSAASAVFAAACIAFVPTSAIAVTRSCGADPVANTADVLCASPSGPCDSTGVNVGTAIEVTSGGCDFDLGGRALFVNRIFTMVGTGSIRAFNASSITITSTGKLKARGDTSNPIIRGGDVRLESSGAISNDGSIDVSGDPGGAVVILANGDISLLPGSEIRGTGTSSYIDDGARYADGAGVTLLSTNGSISVNGEITVFGQDAATGGDVVLQAARNVDVLKAIDVHGGAGGGGTIDIAAGDDITVSKDLNADSNLGGGDGGDVTLTAGVDSLGGIVSGGAVSVLDRTTSASGSSGDGYGGYGGEVRATASGSVLIAGPATMRANAATTENGNGGTIFLSSNSGDIDAVGTLDGDLTFEGTIKARSGSSGGLGGSLALQAGRDLDFDSNVDLGGKAAGGSVDARAGANFSLTRPVLVNALQASGNGGAFNARACNLTLTSTSGIDAAGAGGGQVVLTGRHLLTVSSSSDVDASGTGGSISLVTRAFGTCSNDSSRPCVTSADCTVGCSSGTCQNANPNTGGISQFNPAPSFVADASLPACE